MAWHGDRLSPLQNLEGTGRLFPSAPTQEAMKRLREGAEVAFAAEERRVGILRQEGLLVS